MSTKAPMEKAYGKQNQLDTTINPHTGIPFEEEKQFEDGMIYFTQCQMMS
jgi:hypothetical protein